MLGDPRGVFVATVEHLLAALVGLGIDNATIEIDGPEVPVMDGSAEAFVDAIDRAGIVVQNAPKRFLRIRSRCASTSGAAFAEFRPYDGCRFEVGIAYDCAGDRRAVARHRHHAEDASAARSRAPAPTAT